MGRSHVFPARAARAVRRLWPDRNPLRRTVDRVEAAVGAGLTIAFLAGAPLAAIAAGHVGSSVSFRAAHAQQAARHQVSAVLLAPCHAPGLIRIRYQPGGSPLAREGAPGTFPYRRA